MELAWTKAKWLLRLQSHIIWAGEHANIPANASLGGQESERGFLLLMPVAHGENKQVHNLSIGQEQERGFFVPVGLY